MEEGSGGNPPLFVNSDRAVTGGLSFVFFAAFLLALYSGYYDSGGFWSVAVTGSMVDVGWGLAGASMGLVALVFGLLAVYSKRFEFYEDEMIIRRAGRVLCTVRYPEITWWRASRGVGRTTIVITSEGGSVRVPGGVTWNGRLNVDLYGWMSRKVGREGGE